MTLCHEQRQLCIIMGNFQELKFIILRLRMNLACNDTHISKILHLGGNLYLLKLNDFLFVCLFVRSLLRNWPRMEDVVARNKL